MISQPHDGIFKALLSDITIARDFMAAHLPPAVLERCALSTLRLENSAFIEDKIQQRFSDIVYSLRSKVGGAYIYIVIEHQNQAQRMMPLRMLRYQLGVMQKHLDQKRSKRLPIVISMVFYQGSKHRPYAHPLNIMDCFEQPALAREMFLGPIQLIDLNLIPDEKLRTHQNAAVLEIIMKHIRTKDLVPLFQEVLPLLAKYPLSIDRERAVLHYLMEKGKCSDYEQLIALVDGHAPHYGEQVMTLGQKLRKEGFQEGMQQARTLGQQLRAEGFQEGIEQAKTLGQQLRAEGFQEGIEQGIRNAAAKMLNIGLSTEQIQATTGLGPEEIARIGPKL